MTPTAFRQWLANMKSAGLSRSDAEAGRMLGKSADQIVRYKQKGADHTVALACAALLAGLVPYAGT